MTEPVASTDETEVTFHVKSNQQKFTFTLPLSTTAIDLKDKLSTAEYANVPASSQRLIYSGRVLKDEDTLALHKVKDNNTMHLGTYTSRLPHPALWANMIWYSQVSTEQSKTEPCKPEYVWRNTERKLDPASNRSTTEYCSWYRE